MVVRRALDRIRTYRRLREQLDLDPAEVVLVRIADARGALAIATERAIYHRNGGPAIPATDWERIGWERFRKVRPDDDAGGVWLVGPGQGELWLPPYDGLLELATERVAWTVLASTPVRLAGANGARPIGLVTARRQPGTDRISSSVGLVDRVDPAVPAVRAGVVAAVSRLRADLGR